MRVREIVILIIISGALAFMLAQILNFENYSTFSEAKKQINKNLTVIGVLNTNKPIEYFPKNNILIFYASDKDSIASESKVIFLGAKPQDFERSEEITMTGYATDTAFIANTILMKCPSKYNETNELINSENVGVY